MEELRIDRVLQQLIEQIENRFNTPWLTWPADPALQPLDAQALPQDLPAHSALVLELCCVLQGTALMRIGQEVYRLQEGQLLVLPPETCHNELVDRFPGITLWLVFTKDRVHINITQTQEKGHFSVVLGQSIPLSSVMISLWVNDILKELGQTEYGASTLAKSHLLQILILLCRALASTGERLSSAQWQEDVIKRAVDYLRRHTDARLDQNDLANYCALSPNHLNTVFKAVTGKTVSAYHAALRIQQAKELLSTTALRLGPLAEQLGYYDQYHFCKSFKKATGMSPSQYRKEHEKNT
jgi:AraC-like DNA-binding protein